MSHCHWPSWCISAKILHLIILLLYVKITSISIYSVYQLYRGRQIKEQIGCLLVWWLWDMVGSPQIKALKEQTLKLLWHQFRLFKCCVSCKYCESGWMEWCQEYVWCSQGSRIVCNCDSWGKQSWGWYCSKKNIQQKEQRIVGISAWQWWPCEI